jgi:hypothetical protein
VGKDPVYRQQKAAWIPLATCERRKELVIEVQAQGKNYEFLVDTEADICLIQPYVGEEPTKEITQAVRGITGERLETQGVRRLRVRVGRRWCEHDFVVASFSLKRDGIIELHLLKSLGARINLITEELQVDNQMIKFKSDPSTRRINEQTICCTEQCVDSVNNRHRPKEFADDSKDVRDDRRVMSMKKVTETRTESPAAADTSRRMTEDVRGRQTGSKDGLHEWQAVLPHSVQWEPRSVLVTRAKITDSRRTNIQKSLIRGWAYAEPKEIFVRGVHVARTVSKIFTSSELVDVTPQAVHSQRNVLTDRGGQGTKETVYCTAQLINTSGERIELQAGTKLTDVYDAGKDGVIDDDETSREDEALRVLKTDWCSSQANPIAREQKGGVRKLLGDKLTHLTKDERRVIEPTLLEYQDLLTRAKEGPIPRTDFGYHEIDNVAAAPVKRNPYRIPYALRDELKIRLNGQERSFDQGSNRMECARDTSTEEKHRWND